MNVREAIEWCDIWVEKADSPSGQRVPKNDLYRVVENHPEYDAHDGIHFAESGCKALAEAVADVIHYSPCCHN